MTTKNAGQRQLLKEQAYRQLKQMLLDGTYPPGTFLSERKLAEQLGMSKTPVRAALERVELEGFITVSPQQGIVVRELSLREIKEHYDIRIALETFIARRLAGTLTPEQIAQIEENLRAQIACIEQGDILGHVACDRDFHLLLANCLDNREIVRVMEYQRDKVYRVTSQISLRHPVRMQKSYQEHKKIFEAIRNGDGDLAAVRMQEHLETGRQFIMSA
jgi:DNA-binding GntR family transcriptional regulator